MKKNKKIIKQIENVRKRNNKYWMKLLEIAFDYAPNESKKVMKKINVNDKKISSLISKLSKN
tara:strand:- start:491 stop:676 length:186 start_codon:yes stop_codon:yes gene_type:complete